MPRQPEPQPELVGKRVALISCDDPYTKIAPGTQGTVVFIDDAGTVFVRWDTGERLGLLPHHDWWEVLT